LKYSDNQIVLTHIIHKIIDRYSIRAALNSFGERIFLGVRLRRTRMSDNTISVSMHKIYKLKGLNKFQRNREICSHQRKRLSDCFHHGQRKITDLLSRLSNLVTPSSRATLKASSYSSWVMQRSKGGYL